MVKDLNWLLSMLAEGTDIVKFLSKNKELELLNLIEQVECIETPLIPSFVAAYAEKTSDWSLVEMFDEDFLYNEHEDVAKWLYDNDEETNREREVSLVSARDGIYEIEPEKRYSVMDQHGNFLLYKVIGGTGLGVRIGKIVSEPKGLEQITTLLSEEEIKEFDDRYWIFSEPIEMDKKVADTRVGD